MLNSRALSNIIDILNINGNVRFILNYIEDNSVTTGVINHIAFDETDIHKKLREINIQNIPVVEGINFLPFFKSGVEYFFR